MIQRRKLTLHDVSRYGKLRKQMLNYVSRYSKLRKQTLNYASRYGKLRKQVFRKRQNSKRGFRYLPPKQLIKQHSVDSMTSVHGIYIVSVTNKNGTETCRTSM